MPMSTKRKAPVKLAAPVTKTSAKIPSRTLIDESRTSVSSANAQSAPEQATIDISSDADSDDDASDSASEKGSDEEMSGVVDTSAVNGVKVNGDKSLKTANPEDEEGDDDEPTSPSFGELLRGNETIDVPSLLQQSSMNSIAKPSSKVIVPPSHQSLTTVLTQALRTDDVDLLESCLHTSDLPTIRNTIENIDSQLAGTLLNKLAARLYRRPGRAGKLITWVQWTLIAHGGALAAQPMVTQNLNGLQKVLAERAKGLNSLLALKGKLDLLEGQMDLRKRMQRSSGLLRDGESDDEDDDVVYVEGEEADTSDIGKGLGRGMDMDDDEDDEDDDGPITNGVLGDSDDDEEDDSGMEDGNDNADESLDEDEVDHESVDESAGEDEESDVDAEPPSKMQKVASAFSRRKMA